MVGKPWFLGEEVRDKQTPLWGVTHEGSHPLGGGRRAWTPRYHTAEKCKHPSEQAETNTETEGNIQEHTQNLQTIKVYTDTRAHR